MNNTMNHGGIDPGHEGLSSDITEVMIDEMNGSIRPHVIYREVDEIVIKLVHRLTTSKEEFVYIYCEIGMYTKDRSVS